MSELAMDFTNEGGAGTYPSRADIETPTWVRDVYARDTTDLHEERLSAVVAYLQSTGARSVLDLGCGEGDLLLRLLSETQVDRIVGIDISNSSLMAAQRAFDKLPMKVAGRVELRCLSFTEPNPALAGFEAAVLLETIEHIEPRHLGRVEEAVFRSYGPGHLMVTTPNQEYNVLHGMRPGAMRHPDHRFEWDRARFRRWARGVASRHGYRVRFGDIGPFDVDLGASTQSAMFERLNSTTGD